MNLPDDLARMLADLSADELDQVREFIRFIEWKHARAQTPRVEPWSLNLLEQFAQADKTAERDPAGMEIQVAPAMCAQTTRLALWEHPPVHGAARVTFTVPIPAGQKKLALAFAIGIRDGAELPKDRFVAFRVMVNGWKLWSAVKNSHAWEEYRVELPQLEANVMRLQFETDGLGDHRWNWAVWAEPRLISD